METSCYMLVPVIDDPWLLYPPLHKLPRTTARIAVHRNGGKRNLRWETRLIWVKLQWRPRLRSRNAFCGDQAFCESESRIAPPQMSAVRTVTVMYKVSHRLYSDANTVQQYNYSVTVKVQKDTAWTSPVDD